MATLKELYEQGHKDVWRPITGKTVSTCLDNSYKHAISVFDAICDDWEPVAKKTKKSVTLYRYTIQQYSGEVYQTSWTSKNECSMPDVYKILKTEEKILEWEE